MYWRAKMGNLSSAQAISIQPRVRSHRLERFALVALAPAPRPRASGPGHGRRGEIENPIQVFTRRSAGVNISTHGRHYGAYGVVKAKRKRPFNVNTFLATVNGGRTVSKYQKNQTVFSQGDSADAVFYVQEGKVKATVISNQGKEAIVAIHGKTDFFGEGCLTGQPRRLATVAAMTECVLMRLDKDAVVRLLHNEPAFSEMFLSYILTRNARVEEDLVDQLFNSSEKRLARLLLIMANFGKEGRPEPVIAKISQETLAGMIGTTRSRVSVFMNKFRKLGFLEYDGGDMKVHPSLLNMILHEKPEIRGDADRNG
jgi:CRP-like cAMP-binding protein